MILLLLLAWQPSQASISFISYKNQKIFQKTEVDVDVMSCFRIANREPHGNSHGHRGLSFPRPLVEPSIHMKSLRSLIAMASFK
ncbi:hypothetical protein CHU98_g886 [Xylaria longipes]|nr:hypothetical protein CHU98_g886 [Xylaria longipes]